MSSASNTQTAAAADITYKSSSSTSQFVDLTAIAHIDDTTADNTTTSIAAETDGSTGTCIVAPNLPSTSFLTSTTLPSQLLPPLNTSSLMKSPPPPAPQEQAQPLMATCIPPSHTSNTIVSLSSSTNTTSNAIQGNNNTNHKKSNLVNRSNSKNDSTDIDNSKLTDKKRSTLFAICCCLCVLIQRCFRCIPPRKSSAIKSANANRDGSNSNSHNNSITQMPATENSSTTNTGRASSTNACFLLVEVIFQNRGFLCRKVSVYVIGVLVSVSVCLSFVMMTYLLRKTLNLVEHFTKRNTTAVGDGFNETMALYFNSTYVNASNQSYYHYMLNIEEEEHRLGIRISCDYCYLMVW
jgi:hypothetical protein